MLHPLEINGSSHFQLHSNYQLQLIKSFTEFKINPRFLSHCFEIIFSASPIARLRCTTRMTTRGLLWPVWNLMREEWGWGSYPWSSSLTLGQVDLFISRDLLSKYQLNMCVWWRIVMHFPGVGFTTSGAAQFLPS